MIDERARRKIRLIEVRLAEIERILGIILLREE